MKKYSKEWLLQETINFYTLENRAVGSDGRCKYLSEDGNKCAIGRYLKKGQEKDLMDCTDSVFGLINGGFFEKIIPKWMFKLPDLFLNHVQLLHDTQDNWTNTGLSKKGIEKVKEICQNYSIDFNQITIKV